MRRLLLALATVLIPGTASAQLDDDNRYKPDIEVDPATTKPPGTYVVIEGDTLWDLSEGAFGDGAFWPTLWSYNPQVTNPHWIYPGDLLYLRPRASSRTESKVVYARSRFSERPRLEQVLARFKGFITERQYKSSGKIRGSREEKSLLGELDEAYVNFTIPKRILPGEEYTIYRPEREVKHPKTGKRVGWLIKHLGTARVLSVDRTRPLVKTLILDSFEEIQRGDLITKRVWRNELVVPVENRVKLWTRVYESFHGTSQLGEHDYVIIGKGYKQKIRRGNRLILRWRGDGYTPVKAADEKKYPWENQGEVMVIEPFENTSLAIVLRSFKEVQRGDLLEMVRGY